MPSLLWNPPAVNPANVVYGVSPVYTAPLGTAMPTDANLGVGSAWITAGWSFIGATDGGASVNWNPSTTEIAIEEQSTPVAVLPDKVSATLSFDFSEETLANLQLAYGGGGTIAVTAAGAGQPGKSVLSLSSTLPTLACALVGKNAAGYAIVYSIPAVQSVGSVKTDFRRSSTQRLFPVELDMVCSPSQVTITYLNAPATS